MTPLLIACDFDGTITQRDTLHVVIEAFGVPGLWASIEPRMRSGELSVEAAMEEEFAGVRGHPDDILETVLRVAPVRPGFREFAAWAAAEGHELVVFSAGFRSIIEPVLATQGLSHLAVVSNDAEFTHEGCTISWGLPGPPCERCGRTCKRHAVGERRRGRSVVYIGDGISDRCPALEAEIVFARADLARFLDGQSVIHRPFEDFRDVGGSLRLASAA